MYWGRCDYFLYCSSFLIISLCYCMLRNLLRCYTSINLTYKLVKFGILSVVNIKITIFWDVTHCGLVAGCRYFHRTCCFLVEGRIINPLMPNDPYRGRTTPLTSKRCILYIYSTNIGTEYFKHGIYSPFFSLQNVICFIILTYLVLYYSHFIYRVC